MKIISKMLKKKKSLSVEINPAVHFQVILQLLEVNKKEKEHLVLSTEKAMAPHSSSLA